MYAIVAQAAEQTPTGSPGGSGQGAPGCDQNMLILMVLMFVVFYFVLLRPQQKREKTERRKREEMLKNLKKNDRVVTRGGICGLVASVTDEDVVVKVDEKNDVRVRFLRDAILNVVAEEDEKKDEKKDDKKDDK
jgi:preprotein translocase subunit YajC